METYQTLATESFSSNWLVNKSLPSSLVCLSSSSQDFDFGILLPTSSYTPVNADEIFFDGKMVPSFVKDLNSKSSSYPSTPMLCLHSSPTTRDSPTYLKHFTVIRRWRNCSKKIFKKCLRILLSDSSHEPSGEGSPLDLCPRNTSFDVEDSIYEAIIHCKRSFDKKMM